ncbi:MAG TPA: hypothetical protein VFP56_04475 [Candidatus Limnocylindrales bacterium]|nr:hypothetical protein [Candidatus Limnocylindrales bacterium]
MTADAHAPRSGEGPAASAPGPEAPLVPWEAPTSLAPAAASDAGGYAPPPPFTVGALLSDTFSRYGADFLRFLLVSIVTSALSWLGSFAGPMTSSPFGRPTGFVDVGGLLGLASFVVGIVGGATMFALAEGGRELPFGRAFRRGVERSGWYFLTSLLLGVAFVAVFLIALIPVGLFFFISRELALIPLLILFALFVWVGIRLSLALPAAVADNLNSIEALKLAWRVSKPSGVWLRILAASLLLGLLVAPAALGSLMLVFPAIFTGGGQLALLLVPAAAFSLFTPLASLLSFAAYRRLVPPLQPSGTAPPVAGPPSGAGAPPVAQSTSVEAELTPAVPWTTPSAETPPSLLEPAPSLLEPAPSSLESASPPLEPPPSRLEPAPGDQSVDPAAAAATTARPLPPAAAPPPATPAFKVPRLGTAGKAILALVLAFDVAGIVAIPYGVAAMADFVRDGFPGFPGFPGRPGSDFPGLPGANGEVASGQVAFGAEADLATCSIRFPLFLATASSDVEWIAALENRVTPQDEVFLRISRDGQDLETTLQNPGTYDCLGSEDGDAVDVPGIYTYEVLVNGSVRATGSLFVQ